MLTRKTLFLGLFCCLALAKNPVYGQGGIRQTGSEICPRSVTVAVQ